MLLLGSIPDASGELNATTSPENMVRSDARGMQRISSRSTAELDDDALLFSVGAMAAPERRMADRDINQRCEAEAATDTAGRAHNQQYMIAMLFAWTQLVQI